MSKNADPKTFLRAVVGGFRYSRAPDTTPPSVPVLSPPVPGIGLINIQWINGLDAGSGIASTYAEVSPNGAGTWMRTVVPYPGTSTTFTGLPNALPFDIRLANVDNAGNVSAYTAIQTTTTLPSAADLEPGTVALSSTGFSVNENTFFSASIVRSGAGASSPAIEVDWAFSGFNQGTPSPANGTLSWAGAENGSKLIQTTAGNVTANQTGLLKIVAVRALAGNISPTVGSPSQASVTIIVVNQLGKKFNPGFYMMSGQLTETGDANLSSKIVEQNLCQSSGPKVLGWAGRYRTNIVGNTPGVFDFSIVFNDLNRLRALSPARRMMIIMLCNNYSSTNYTTTIPSSIYNNSAYGASPVAGKYGWWYINGGNGETLAFWRPAVMDFVISLFQALASAVNPQTGLTLDQDPLVEMVAFTETASSPFNTGPAGADPTWSTNAIFTQYKRLIDAMVLAWPNTIFSVWNNYCQSTANAQALTNYILQKGCAQGGPDTWVGAQLNSPQSLTWGQAAALGVAQGDPTFSGPDLRGKIGMLSVTEGTESTFRNPYTPITFFNQINNVLRQGHCVLTCEYPNATDDPIPPYPQEGKNTGANPGNWHSMMQVINGQNLTHIQKPTGIA